MAYVCIVRVEMYENIGRELAVDLKDPGRVFRIADPAVQSPFKMTEYLAHARPFVLDQLEVDAREEWHIERCRWACTNLMITSHCPVHRRGACPIANVIC